MTAYRIISAEKARTPVSLACELLGVSRSGFYAWERRAPSDRALTDAWLIEQIRRIDAENRGDYGWRRVRAELRFARGVQVSGKRVKRLMRQAGISGLVRRKRGRTTIRVPGVRVADDLVERRFRPHASNLLWIADLYSRRIVGWSMAERMRAELVVDALEMAVARRRPDPGLIHHSDQGSQYVSLAFGQTARDAGIALSRGSRGDCFDNAVADSLFATLKKELVHRRAWPTRHELTSEVFEYIEAFYNRQRRQSTLDYLSPADCENRTLIGDRLASPLRGSHTHPRSSTTG